MTKQIISMTMATPKVSDPTEKAIDVTSYNDDGGSNFSGDGGTFYMQKNGVESQIVETMMEKITGHFKFRLKLTNGDDVTPAMNPTITAYGVTMEEWGVSGHYAVPLTWDYDTTTQLYSVTLSDGAVSPYGYAFQFNTASGQTANTQQPNIFMAEKFWDHSGGTLFATLFMPRDEPYDATIYYGIFRFNITQDCVGGTPSVDEYTAKIHNSAGVIVGTTVQWVAGWRCFFLTWDAACDLDPDGYWVRYDCTNATTQQYPRRYVKQGVSSPDWFQDADLIHPGDYSDTVIYLNIRHAYQALSTNVVDLVETGSSNCFTLDGGTFTRDVAGTAASPDYPGYTGPNGLVFKPDGGGYFHYLVMRCSVPYQIKYHVRADMNIGTYQLPGSPTCDQKNATIHIDTDDPAISFLATNGGARPALQLKDYPASCTEVWHYTESFFNASDNPGMDFAVSDRFVPSINFVKLV